MIRARKGVWLDAEIRLGPARHSARTPGPGRGSGRLPEAAPDHWERLPRAVAALAFHSAEPNPVAIEALEALRRQPSVTPDYSTGGFSL